MTYCGVLTNTEENLITLNSLRKAIHDEIMPCVSAWVYVCYLMAACWPAVQIMYACMCAWVYVWLRCWSSPQVMHACIYLCSGLHLTFGAMCEAAYNNIESHACMHTNIDCMRCVYRQKSAFMPLRKPLFAYQCRRILKKKEGTMRG